MKPNIFTWATSELSQDAFICWLLSWADIKYQKEKLHPTAIYFIQKLTGNKIASIINVDVERQVKGIDILCRINNEFVILIEDKTRTSNHSDQLNKYYSYLKTLHDEDKIFPVYLKTGQQSNFASIHKAGYKLFLRNDFLDVFEFAKNHQITDTIFLDFFEHLKKIEADINSFIHLPVMQWHWESWKGFYSYLQTQLGDGEWDYVPQKNGGFLGFWWSWGYKEPNSQGFDYYLQLEHSKFCFKIHPYNKDYAYQTRDYFRSLLYPKAKEHGIAIYQNGRIGNYMTVAALSESYIKVDESGLIDLEKTIKYINHIEKMFADI